MPLNPLGLMRRLLRRSLQRRVFVPKPLLESLENRTVPTTTVTVEAVADATEDGSPGVFRFTRTGDELSQPLTVGYSVGGTATAGDDYVPLTGSATFAPNESTVDVSVAPGRDNFFEDPETISLSLSDAAGAYLVGMDAASLTLQDDPPRVTVAATWDLSGESQIGEVAVTRTGGDTSQPVTAYFEFTGWLSYDEAVLAVGFAATAVVPAGVTGLTIPVLADAAEGGIADLQLPGAQLAPGRPDQSSQLLELLNGVPGNGTRFATAVTNLPNPITLGEYLVLRSIVRGEYDGIYTLNEERAMHAAAESRMRDLIDWRSVPQPVASTAIMGGLGTAAGIVASIPDWVQLDQQLNVLLAQLALDDFNTREQAQATLQSLLATSLQRGDISRATVILTRLEGVHSQVTSADLRNRLDSLLRFGWGLKGAQAYADFRLLAVASVAGGGVFGW